MTLASRKTQDGSDPAEAEISHDALTTHPVASPLSWNDMHPSEHLVQFYETDDFLLDALSDFIGAGLGSGAACIVIATQAHREGLSQRLQVNGLDPASAHAAAKSVSSRVVWRVAIARASAG